LRDARARAVAVRLVDASRRRDQWRAGAQCRARGAAHMETRLMSARRATAWDAIVIGAGHNGLVCAAYLGAAGLRVAVLERRDRLGGMADTSHILPGVRVPSL